MTVPGPAGQPYPVPPGHGGPSVQAGHGGSGAAPPPPGPGAVPPFAAPPIEGRSVRMWLGLGVGALAVLLCCGGGAAALVGLAVSAGQAVDEQSRTVVGDYFRAVSDRDYAQAYALLCDAEQQRQSPGEFQRRVAAEPGVASYRVGRAEGTSDVTVPVDVRYTGGGSDTLQVTLVPDRRSGKLEVCGIS